MTDAPPLADPAALTRRIGTRCQAERERQLPDLVRLAEMVEDPHAGETGAPDGLAALLRRSTGEMEDQAPGEALPPVPVVRKGDGAIPRDRIAAIRRLTDGPTPPPLACAPRVMLDDRLAGFPDALTGHIRLENESLLPRIGAQAHG